MAIKSLFCYLSSKMVNTPLEQNRDYKRQNKATSVVDATIFSYITANAVQCIHDLCDTSFETYSEDTIKDVLQKIVALTKICTNSNKIAKLLYMKSSTYLKQGADTIALEQVGFLKRSIMFKEVDDLEEVMDHYDKRMLIMQTNIYNMIPKHQIRSPDIPAVPSSYDNDQRTTPSVTTHIPPSIRPISTFSPPLVQVTNTIWSLPLPSKVGHYYNPLEAVLTLIHYGDDVFRYCSDIPVVIHKGIRKKYRMSENFIINLMINKGFIPINKTSMYALLKQFKTQGYLNFDKWRDSNKPGPKPLIERKKLTGLVDQYAKATDGGCASSRLNLEDSINQLAKEETQVRSGSKRKFDSLPVSSMDRVVNRVMGLHKFNIMNTVSNKTQSRSAAEFSIRSAIAYMMVVLSSHFINAPPSPYHSKHDDITKTPVYKLISKLNKEVLGANLIEKDILALTYILPNLITSTDECTLFISSQQINNKISWYFCVRPSLSNSPSKDSNRRDCFTTDLTGDAESLHNIKKDELIEMAFARRDSPIQPKHHIRVQTNNQGRTESTNENVELK